MKNNTQYIRAVILIILPLLFSSCRKELCYNHFRSISFNLTYEHEWERDYGKAHKMNWDASQLGLSYDHLRPARPEWINIIRFSNHSDQREYSLGPEGGDMMVDEGAGQSFLLYNGDTEYIILSDMVSAPNARASATGRSRASLTYVSEIHPNARTTNPPDILYSAYVENVPAVEMHENLPMPVKMQPLVYTYLVRYEFEHGIEHVALAHGALGGMAESVYLKSGTTSDNTSIVLYDCDIKDYGCEARVRTFGVPSFPDEYYGQMSPEQGEKKPYTLNLEVRLKNGTFVEFNYDISDQIDKQPRGGIITVSGLRIEDDQNLFESGFNVDIEGWGDHQDIDLPVGPDKK